MATHNINVTGEIDPAAKSTGGNESADAGKLLVFNTEGQIQGSSGSASLAAVKGTASGSGYGVHGESVDGMGVVAQSVNKNGLDAASNNSRAISAVNLGATDPVIFVKNANVANTAPLAMFRRNNNQGLTIKNDGGLEWDSATGAATSRTGLGLGTAAVEDAATTSTADAVVKALATGKIDTSFLPDSVLGQLEYQGAWNAATNTPAIPAASSSNLGWYYIASASVAVGHGYANVPNVAFDTGDWIVSNGTTWDKIDNTDAVASVFGRGGAIVAANGDYNAGQVTNTPAGNIAATTVQAALNELDTEKQPLDSDLTAIAALTPANDDVIQRKAGSWVNRTMAQLWADLLSLASAVFIPVARANIAILPTQSGTAPTWTAMPAALNFFLAQNRWQINADLTGAKRIRFSVNMPTVVGFAGSKLLIRYRTFASGSSTVATDFSPLGSGATEVQAPIDTAGPVATSSGYINITASAKTTVIIALLGIGGDGIVTPVFLNANIDIEYAP